MVVGDLCLTRLVEDKMSDNFKALPDLLPNIKFNSKAQEQFASARGVVFEHWSAIPSPIGLKDRGDYRRSEALDTVSENGFIYKKVGEFVGTIVSNGHGHSFSGPSEGGIYDKSTARIIIPKFYKNCPDKEISLLPGDRVYAKDIELKVENYQRAEYNPNGSDYLQFPAKCVNRLVDSRGIEYEEGRQFKIDKDGNISWMPGQDSPGIDPDTGRGRVYSVRYKYVAFWYIQQLINEVRITNTEGAETPDRMPYHAVIQREYVYHSKNRGSEQNTPKEQKESPRNQEEVVENIDPESPQVHVDVKNFTE